MAVELPPVALATAALGLAIALLLLKRFLPPAGVRALPGPSQAHWLYGNEWDVYRNPAGRLWNAWSRKYGAVFKYRNAFFNGWTLAVADPAAIKAILQNDGVAFHKPPFNRATNERLLGRGVIWAEGQDHRHQRRLLSPAFSTSSIKAVSGAFYRTAEDIKDSWHALLDRKDSEVVNVAEFMSSAALDVIGAAGFEHDFNAVRSATAEARSVTDGLAAALGAPPSFKIFATLTLAKAFPTIFNHAPLKAIRNQRRSKVAIDKVARGVLARVEAQGASHGKSVLSILLAEREKGSGLDDRQILDNISTMITAGHETTGITLSFVLYELARHPEIQARVRGELLTHSPTFEQLQDGAAPLLDAVLKEILRLYPANIRIIRRAERDTAVPLAFPLQTSKGELNSIVIPANTDVVLPITAINRLEACWGADADAFRPDRWLDDSIPEAVKHLPGGYDHIFTFVSGPRACLGMRFALAEMRVILSTLLANFSFAPDSERPLDVVSPTQIMLRAQDAERGVYGVPLVIKRLD